MNEIALILNYGFLRFFFEMAVHPPVLTYSLVHLTIAAAARLTRKENMRLQHTGDIVVGQLRNAYDPQIIFSPKHQLLFVVIIQSYCVMKPFNDRHVVVSGKPDLLNFKLDSRHSVLYTYV